MLCMYMYNTSGYGLAWPEQSICPPELFENSILYGGSFRNTGPCKSSGLVSEK